MAFNIRIINRPVKTKTVWVHTCKTNSYVWASHFFWQKIIGIGLIIISATI